MLRVVASGAMSGPVLGGAGWEAFAADAASDGPTPGNGSSASMGANVAAWRSNFVAEAAAGKKKYLAQGLIDLVKCFETTPHMALSGRP